MTGDVAMELLCQSDNCSCERQTLNVGGRPIRPGKPTVDAKTAGIENIGPCRRQSTRHVRHTLPERRKFHKHAGSFPHDASSFHLRVAVMREAAPGHSGQFISRWRKRTSQRNTRRMMESQRSDGDQEPESLLFESSPTGAIDAIVQSDERTVYFYLNGSRPFGTRACWVRNLVPGPLVADANDMAEGRPPLLPRTAEKPNAPRAVPVPDDLSIVWFEECNGAALLERGDVLAVIPPWSGEEGFWGYARDAAIESPLASPLPDHPDLIKRIVRAAEFWAGFEQSQGNPFERLQKSHLDALTRQFGGADATVRYFAIDGGKFPPCGLVVFMGPQSIVTVTIGMSLLPQPNVELVDPKPWLRRRVELGIQLPAGTNEDLLQKIWRNMAGLSRYPWRRQSWFGDGHTVEFSALKDIYGDQTTMIRLSGNLPEHASAIKFSRFRGDPVNLLWMIPTSSAAGAAGEGSSP